MESEIVLPRSSVKALVKKYTSPSLRNSSVEISDAIGGVALTFIHELVSKSYSDCVAKGKKTIVPDNVFAALESMHFPINKEELEKEIAAYEDMKSNKPSLQLKLQKSGKSHDELIEEQEKLLASAQQNSQAEEREIKMTEDVDEYD
ncbi:DR1 [Blepharisma stoltei]|uniref:Transcription factor CBF/NF-Y/archaeal histone domain-containing protein n=1 Tax=Blepharisma stoltei TaxID=1481888 RepID=A0AAU9J2L0_9CILI|nr:unnamed protein product [Blepharisma stoltei]